ncbi:MAG: TRAP transporter small permease [Alkalispirochaeta sp.]
MKNGLKGIGPTIGKIVDYFEVTIILFSTAMLSIVSISNVIARNIYRSFYFAEELSQFFIMMITFIGTSYAARKARHIRMGALLEAFPPKLEKIMIFIISAVSATVLFVLAYIAFDYLLAVHRRGTTTFAMGAPYWTFVAVAPLGLAMAGIQYVRTIIKNIQEKEVWLSPEQQSEYEEEAVMMAAARSDAEEVHLELKEKK